MYNAKIKIFVLLFAFWQQACVNSDLQSRDDSSSQETVISQDDQNEQDTTQPKLPLQMGAEQLQDYLPLLRGKRLGLVVNQTSTIGKTHLVDSLLTYQLDIKAVFAPEHGFRGDADAGEKIADGRDPQTGIPIISLYGKHKEPTAEDLKNIDLLIFDIQDVGARFYTYISTLHYVLQAGAKHNVPILVLDRPNPNGHYVDGPILDPNFQSFVGMHPVPVVHGMTVGEYAQMVVGENWLDNGLQPKLTIIKCTNYTHQTPYDLPVAPSPNLPNMRSIYLYPSMCFFEGTVFSEGRGTNLQFQVYGHPDFNIGSYQFTPRSGPGSKYPKLENQTCKGVSLERLAPEAIRAEGQINLFYLLQAYTHFPDQKNFFLPNHFIDKLAGSSRLREQITAGWTAEQIRASWQADLEAYHQVRAKYLLYE